MAGLPIVAGGPGVSAMALSRRGSGRALSPPSSPRAHSRSAAKLAALGVDDDRDGAVDGGVKIDADRKCTDVLPVQSLVSD